MKALVLGDVMLDEYLQGTLHPNPEHVQDDLRIDKQWYGAGGAANVAANLASLGIETTLMGVCGCDREGAMLQELVEAEGIDAALLNDPTRPTIKKTRLLEPQYGRRISFDTWEETLPGKPKVWDGKQPIHAKQRARVLERAEDFTWVVLSDYAKGTISAELVGELNNAGKYVLVDPKPEHIGWYAETFVVKPNEKEARAVTNQPPEQAVHTLQEQLRSYVMVTAGKNGVYVHDGEMHHLPGRKVEKVIDVVGAGDTVMATLTYGLMKGMSLLEASRLANEAGAVAVQHQGCYHITQKDLNGM